MLLGKINFNLFPQYIQEDNNRNNNLIIIDANRCEYDIPELKFVIVLNKRNIGPFKGQKRFICHPHYLTKYISNRLGYQYDYCSTIFNSSSYYCGECDFDLCRENCNKITKVKKPKIPDSSWQDCIRSP